MSTLKTQEMELNMGPHHPSTHGVIRFILKTDGEIISECKPDVGYLHRSIEKIGEQTGYPGENVYLCGSLIRRVPRAISCTRWPRSAWGSVQERA